MEEKDLLIEKDNIEELKSVNILPLKEQTFNDIYNNKMNEADVIDSQIERYDNNKEYYLYLSSISASTEHGEKVCKKLLKMDYIRDTSHNSKIYCVDGNNFAKSINKIMKFLDE